MLKYIISLICKISKFAEQACLHKSTDMYTTQNLLDIFNYIISLICKMSKFAEQVWLHKSADMCTYKFVAGPGLKRNILRNLNKMSSYCL